MIVFLISQCLSAWFAYLLPCYSTFKTLSHEPVSQPELQKLAIYWTVIGAFIAFESITQCFISWLPFYWELRTLFLLFLSLPQTQGSTFIYNTYLQPFLKKNEHDLDAAIVAAQQSSLTFIQSRLSGLWEFLWSLINKSTASAAPGVNPQPGSSPGISLENVMGLWRTYGSSVLGALQPGARAAPNVAETSKNSAMASSTAAASSSVHVSNAERRNPNSFTPESEPLPNPYDKSPSVTPANSVPSSAAPSFPEPQFH